MFTRGSFGASFAHCIGSRVQFGPLVLLYNEVVMVLIFHCSSATISSPFGREIVIAHYHPIAAATYLVIVVLIFHIKVNMISHYFCRTANIASRPVFEIWNLKKIQYGRVETGGGSLKIWVVAMFRWKKKKRFFFKKSGKFVSRKIWKTPPSQMAR